MSDTHLELVLVERDDGGVAHVQRYHGMPPPRAVEEADVGAHGPLHEERRQPLQRRRALQGST